MKKHLSFLLVSVVLILTGCQHRLLDPQGAYHGDQNLFAADQVIATANEVFEKLLTFELTHRATLSPDVTKAADAIRDAAPRVLQDAVEARDAYKNDPTQANAEKLAVAIGILRSSLSIASSYIVTANPTH